MTKTNKRRVVMIVSLVLIACIAIGGTIAWLTDKTDAVTNTFTIGNIKITLTETAADSYKIIPGGKSDKDPVLTVKANSEKCYAFVLVDNNLVIDGAVVGTPNIDSTKWTSVETSGTKTLYRYYQAVPASTSDTTLAVFTEVDYASTLTAANLATLDGKTIVLTGFAIQADNITEAEALAQAKTALGIA